MKREHHSHLNKKEKEIFDIIRARNQLTIPEDLFPLVDEDKVSQPSDFRSFFRNEIMSSFDRVENKRFRDSRGVKFVANFWQRIKEFRKRHCGKNKNGAPVPPPPAPTPAPIPANDQDRKLEEAPTDKSSVAIAIDVVGN